MLRAGWRDVGRAGRSRRTPVWEPYTTPRGRCKHPFVFSLDRVRVFVVRCLSDERAFALRRRTVTPPAETDPMAAVLSPRFDLFDSDALRPPPTAVLGGEAFPDLAPWNDPSARPARPQLRLVEGGRSAAPRPSARHALRAVLGGLALAALVALAALGAVNLLGADAAASGPASTAESLHPAGADASTPSASAVVVVQPGDTLWAIARRIQPTGDIRPLVDELADRAGGAAVVVRSAPRPHRPGRLTSGAPTGRCAHARHPAVASPPCDARPVPTSTTRWSTRVRPTTASPSDVAGSAWPAASGSRPSSASRRSRSWW